MDDILKVQGRMTLGYGVIPKIVMQDRNLTPEAKCIYAYFCSYAGAGTTSFPGREKILHDLKISKDRYYSHFKLLKKYGYVEVEQNTNNKGKFKNNIYTLIEMIAPCPENKDTEKPCPCFPDTENKDIKNNSIKNNNNENTIQSVSQSESSCKYNNDYKNRQTDRPNKQKKDLPEIAYINDFKTNQTNYKYNYKQLISILQDNIEYSFWKNNKPTLINFIDEIIFIMVDTILTQTEYITIKQQNKPSDLVKGTLMKLRSVHIEYVIDRFQNVTKRIKDKKSYLLSCLYNSYAEIDSHYENLYNSR